MLTHNPILVVEDSDEDYDTFTHALQKSGIRSEVYHASSGDECLALLHEKFSMNVEKPSLIMLDLNMPGMDGRETLRLIKSDHAFKGIPVIVFTTSSNPQDITQCYEYGANAYHVKPIQYPEHLSILECIFQYWLNKVRGPGHGLKN